MQEAILDADNTLFVFLVDAAGAPVTGVVLADLGAYSASIGLGAVNIPQIHMTLVEVSAANQPGWYELRITAAHFATLGRASIRVYDVLAGGFVDWNDTVNVVTLATDDAIRKLLGLSKQNSVVTVLTTNAVGYMLTGTLDIYDDKTLTSLITSYNIIVTYAPVTYELQTHTVTEV